MKAFVRRYVMNILQVHNYYQIRGGEDAVVEAEREMLAKRGHNVTTYYVRNDRINNYSLFQKLKFLLHIVYNPASVRRLREILERDKIDIVHIHNYWPLISPSVLFYLSKKDIPFVLTVHNYRYVVANALLYKDDVSLHEDGEALVKVRYRGLNSYRGSYLLTFIYWLAARLVKWTGLWRHGKRGMIVLNELAYRIHKQHFKTGNISIKRNSLDMSCLPEIPSVQVGQADNIPYYLYLGRISREKGLETLIDAFILMNGNSARQTILKIAGDGPFLEQLKSNYSAYNFIQFIPFVSGISKYTLLAGARAMIIPSQCHENCPVTILEAGFYGVPVIASSLGGIPDIITHTVNGLLFSSGNVSSLLSCLKWCEDHPSQLKIMGQHAAKFCQENFDEESNYRQLIAIYTKTISRV